MSVTAEPATVYRGGGRRWFTLKGACSAEAKAKLKERCYCDHYDSGIYGGQHLPCKYHNGSERASKILRRLTRLHIAAYRAL